MSDQIVPIKVGDILHLEGVRNDLYSACKSSLAELQKIFAWQETGMNLSSYEGPSETIMAMLEKAIAKAEGRS